jgi:acyl dehydratase
MFRFEDFTAGMVVPLGERRLGRDEIVAFARRWDPQPFHLDEDAAAASLLGGLAASGWHTAAVLMRLFVDGLLSKSASLGSPGIDTLRWLKPVRPGTVLSATLTVLETRASNSRPTVGLVGARFDVVDDAGDPVMTMTGTVMFARETAA